MTTPQAAAEQAFEAYCGQFGDPKWSKQEVKSAWLTAYQQGRAEMRADILQAIDQYDAGKACCHVPIAIRRVLEVLP